MHVIIVTCSHPCLAAWSTQAHMQVVENVGCILVGTGFACSSSLPRGTLPQENFGFLDLLRSFLMQFWSNESLQMLTILD